VQAIDRIPQELKAIYSTAFEVEPRWLVESASRRQKWIDQAQSLNLYINNANGKKLDVTYRMAWFSGLKTTYYLRSLAATGTEKSTIDTGTLNAVSRGEISEGGPAPVPAACSLDDPDCEACQ
jgi:ribonucleoside-diphosphate reductase alpha chain